MFIRWFFFVAMFVVPKVSGQTRTAVAHLVTGTVKGSIIFTETSAGLRVTGNITGLADGNYGFHVHELGDISDCNAAGAHFNPDGHPHAGRDQPVRHVGDLGNIVFVGNDSAVAFVDFEDSVISLQGRNSILGRSLVLHEQEDDLGLGGHENSLSTGNAGARVACGVIGIRSPADPWNSAVSVFPPILLLISTTALAFYSM